MPTLENNFEKADFFSRNKNFDVVIVGSGPAGAVIASELVTKGRRVALLEAGSRLPETDFSKFFEFMGYKNSLLNFGMSWQLGGTSNLWAGRCAPMDEYDISESRGWPFERQKLNKYYAYASRFLGLEPWESVEQILGVSEKQAEWFQLIDDDNWIETKFQWNRPCFNARPFLENLASRNENFWVLLNSRALTLSSEHPGHRIKALEVATDKNERFNISARAYVLACGGIEIPRIILNSNQINGTRIGHKSNIVGKYLSTHPKTGVGRLHLKKAVQLNTPMFVDSQHGDMNLRFGLGRSPSSLKRSGHLNHYVQFSAKFEKIGYDMIEHLRESVSLNNPNSNLKGKGYFNKFRSMTQFAAIASGRAAFNVIGKLGVLQRSASLLSVRGFFDQHPSDKNIVKLSHQKDQFDMPKASVCWEFSEEDYGSVEDFLNELKINLAHKEVGTLDIEFDRHKTRLNGIHSHFLGTARMGHSSSSSVANGEGQVHDHDNLYLAGSCLLPSYGYANPVLTICALAKKTADHIENSWKF